MKSADRDRDERLTLYAVDGLDAEQSADVEEMLESDPGARDELEQIRDVLSAVLRAAPEPEAEPDWKAMAADVREACAAQSSWKQRLRRLLGAKYTIPGAVAMTVAVALLAVVTLGSDKPNAVATTDADAGVTAPIDKPDTKLDLRIGELDEMTGDELAALEESLDELEPTLAELEPTLADDEAGDENTADPTLDVFGEPEYEWVDDLSEEELTRLAQYLATQAG